VNGAELGLFIASSLRLAMPLLLAATGELVSEKAGVLNLSLEGMMLAGAFAAAIVSLASGSPISGLLAGVGASLIVALAQAVLSITIRADQLVVGIGFNILILGITTFLFREIRGVGASDLIPGLPTWSIPGLASLPILGPALFQHSSLFYVGLLLVVGTWALLAYTSFGLSVRSARIRLLPTRRGSMSAARVMSPSSTPAPWRASPGHSYRSPISTLSPRG
jgi:ABC-type uncharacterized transport system permease subunit